MTNIETKILGFRLRFAQRGDVPLIVKYIRDLAAYEGELDQVTCTSEVLERDMFDRGGAEALIGEFNGVPVGFALFHPTFSTFLGRKGMGLVDLYIEPEMRGKGFGKTMLSYLAQLAVERIAEDWNGHVMIGMILRLNYIKSGAHFP